MSHMYSFLMNTVVLVPEYSSSVAVLVPSQQQQLLISTTTTTMHTTYRTLLPPAGTQMTAWKAREAAHTNQIAVETISMIFALVVVFFVVVTISSSSPSSSSSSSSSSSISWHHGCSCILFCCGYCRLKAMLQGKLRKKHKSKCRKIGLVVLILVLDL
jgi:hypothetical protein